MGDNFHTYFSDPFSLFLVYTLIFWETDTFQNRVQKAIKLVSYIEKKSCVFIIAETIRCFTDVTIF